jgi:hypothetical protein
MLFSLKWSHWQLAAGRSLGTRADEGAFFASGGSTKHSNRKYKALAAVSVLGLLAGTIGSVLAQQKKEITFWHIQSAEPGLSLIK